MQRGRLAAVSGSFSGSCICHLPLHPLNVCPFPFITIKRTLSQRGFPQISNLSADFFDTTRLFSLVFLIYLLVDPPQLQVIFVPRRYSCVSAVVRLHLLLVHALQVYRSREASRASCRTSVLSVVSHRTADNQHSEHIYLVFL